MRTQEKRDEQTLDIATAVAIMSVVALAVELAGAVLPVRGGAHDVTTWLGMGGALALALGYLARHRD